MSNAMSIPNHNDLVSVKEKKEVIKSHIDIVYADIQNLGEVPYYFKSEIDTKLDNINNQLTQILNEMQILGDRITAIGG